MTLFATLLFSFIFPQAFEKQMENQYFIETYNLWDFNKHTLKMGIVNPAVLNLNRVISFSFCSEFVAAI